MAVNLNPVGYLDGVRFRWLALQENVNWYSLLLLCLKLQEMSSVGTFDGVAIRGEGYDVTRQEHYLIKKRCNCSCCDCFHTRCTFRVWQILLFLFIVVIIIAGLALIIAMFGTGNIASKHSAIKETDSPDDTGKQISLI